jgi:predicted XRE-type DNA-binding protein
MMDTHTFADAFDALSDTPAEAANLRARADLMQALAALVAEAGWTQAEAARRCGVTQPRMNDLLRGRISRFSLDALVNMAAACGQRVQLGLHAA